MTFHLAEYRFEKDTAVINHTHKLEPSTAAAAKASRQMRVTVMVADEEKY